MSRQRRRQRDERRAAEAATKFNQAVNVDVPGISIDIGTPLNMPNGERWIFNITRARELIRATVNRDLHQFSGQGIAQLLARFALDKDKVLAADHTVPGIGAVIPFGGQRALQIIEGAERACQAFRLDKPFLLYVLTDAERDQCLWSRTGMKGIGEMLITGRQPKAE